MKECDISDKPSPSFEMVTRVVGDQQVTREDRQWVVKL